MASANIRFVKPPPDNRIRHFPYVSGDSESPSFSHSLKPTETDSSEESSSTLHITTPKKRKNHLPRWDIFITSRPETASNFSSHGTSSGASHQSENPQSKTSPPHTKSVTTVKIPRRIEVSNRSDMNLLPHEMNAEAQHKLNADKSKTFGNSVVKKTNDNKANFQLKDIGSKLQPNEKPTSANDEEEKATGCKEPSAAAAVAAASPVTKCVPSQDASSPIIVQGWMDQPSQMHNIEFSQAPPSTNETRSTANETTKDLSLQTQTSPSHADMASNRQSIGLSEVSEEEIASLPEVGEPAGSVTSSDSQLQSCQYQEDSRKQLTSHETKQDSRQGNTEGQSSIDYTVHGNANSSKSSWIGLPRRPYPMEPLRRSISEYDFHCDDGFDEEDDEDVSFFSRIKASKHSKVKRPNLQDTRADSFDKTTGYHNNNVGQSSAHRYAWTERTVRDAVFFGGSDLVLSVNDRSVFKQDSISLSGKTPTSTDSSRTSTPVETLTTPKALRRSSRDAVHSARLAMRRFALADPERMIISQEMREKLEKDIERRKSSAVRKVSQFFNIQLGLNKEEDLI